MDQELIAYFDTHFRQIDGRFGQIDARFGRIDARFGQIDARFDQIDTRFDQIDTRFDQIDTRFETLERELRGEIATVRQELGGEIATVRQELGGEIATLSGDLDAFREQTRQRFTEINGELTKVNGELTGVKDSVHLTGVQVEKLRDQIQQVAEGVAGNSEKIEALKQDFRKDLKEEIDSVKGLLRSSHSDLDRRVTALEGRFNRRDSPPQA